MARWPLETTRLTVEGTSYLTIYAYIVCATSVQLCQYSDYFIKTSSSLFLKLRKQSKIS